MSSKKLNEEFNEEEFDDEEFEDAEFDREDSENGEFSEDEFENEEDGFEDEEVDDEDEDSFEDEEADDEDEGGFEDDEDSDEDDDDFDIDEENGIEIPCPECSPKESVWHEILKPGRNPVARCMDCGNIHSYTVEKSRLKDVKVIVSKMENTVVLRCLFDENERYDIDDEIIADDENTGEAYPVMITAIECGNRRPSFARVKDIDTIWARSIDEVTVRIAIKKGEITSSVMQKVPGEFQFVVGADIKIDSKKTLPILAIKVRGGGFRRKEGDTVPAKKVKRIFTKDHQPSYGKYKSKYGKNGGRRYNDGRNRNGDDRDRPVYRYDNGEEMSDRDRRYREWYDRQNSRGAGGNYRRNINERDAGYSSDSFDGNDSYSGGYGNGYGKGGSSYGARSSGNSGKYSKRGSGDGFNARNYRDDYDGNAGGYGGRNGSGNAGKSGSRHRGYVSKKPTFQKNTRQSVNRGRK